MRHSVSHRLTLLASLVVLFVAGQAEAQIVYQQVYKPQPARQAKPRKGARAAKGRKPRRGGKGAKAGNASRPGQGTKGANAAKPQPRGKPGQDTKGANAAKPQPQGKPGRGTKGANAAKPRTSAGTRAQTNGKVPLKGHGPGWKRSWTMPWSHAKTRPAGQAAGAGGSVGERGGTKTGSGIHGAPGSQGSSDGSGGTGTKAADATASKKILRVWKVTVIGVTKTSKETVRAMSEIHRGDLITPEYVDRVRKRLINTKVFRKVSILWEEIPNRPGWAAIFLECKDRWSWFIAPMFTWQQGRWGGALAYGEANLFGWGKRLGVAGAYLTDSQYLGVGYQDPSIHGSRFVLKVGLGFKRQLFKEYLRILGKPLHDAQSIRSLWVQQLSATMTLGYKWWGKLETRIGYKFALVAFNHPKCPFQTGPDGQTGDCATPWDEYGGSYSGPIVFRQKDGTYLDHTYAKGKFWRYRREGIVQLGIGYSTVLDLFGIKQGWSVGFKMDISHPHLGSQFQYVKWSVSGYKAFRFFKSHVLELFAKHEEAYGAPYHRELYMGGSYLPGYVYRQALGDMDTSVKAAYSVPLFHVWWFSFRQVFYYRFAWIFFRDGGKKRPYYEEHNGVRRYHLAFEPGPKDRASFLESIGTGLRLHVKAVAMPLLGVDVAYGFEANAVRFYFYVGKNY
ncbi:MAG: BamA/TamA family outer membrane protein [Deltaproteobacteria bacterium]|nr:BamA/TamA family outer membrane protein [Deltaproteobacteria bacterium]